MPTMSSSGVPYGRRFPGIECNPLLAHHSRVEGDGIEVERLVDIRIFEHTPVARRQPHELVAARAPVQIFEGRRREHRGREAVETVIVVGVASHGILEHAAIAVVVQDPDLGQLLRISGGHEGDHPARAIGDRLDGRKPRVIDDVDVMAVGVLDLGHKPDGIGCAVGSGDRRRGPEGPDDAALEIELRIGKRWGIGFVILHEVAGQIDVRSQPVVVEIGRLDPPVWELDRRGARGEVMDHAHVHGPPHAHPGLMIGLDDGIAGLAVPEDFRIIDAPYLDVQTVRAGQIDIPIAQGDVSGEEVDILLGQGAERAVTGNDADAVIDPALGVQRRADSQREEADKDRD